ncbi:MAG: UDP-3-O-[3-hydroxymyristoyl] N-acetylglucosamine deacetylase [Campylobacteraceae bacterium 4484_4]|nr:MAG: UDP-3-O-[3-hydroxymyristoyl] N-acetylglucosamine deacetylase [Campylobacteraceae bacterium 4484_4]
MKQRTIKKRIDGVGIGLHKGEPVRLSIEPLDPSSGIVFYRSDTGSYIEAKPENVVNTQMATVIGKGHDFVSTIEHLLSSVYAFGLDNLLIRVDAPEVPIMDGSSASFCMMFHEAGIISQEAAKKVMIIKKEVEVRDGNKFVKVSPSATAQFLFSIDFAHPSIGYQKYNFQFSRQKYLNEIARARTFGFLQDIQMLRSRNLALGGSLENAIVLDEKKILNSEGLRYDNEFVRHKILDAMGDLTLLGMPLLASYESFAGSHHLNHLLTKEILSDPENYAVKELSSVLSPLLTKAFA